MRQQRRFTVWAILGMVLGIGTLIAGRTQALETVRVPQAQPLQAASASFTYHSIDSSYKFCTAVATADLDSNGWIDVLAASEDGVGWGHWWQNSGSQTLIAQPAFSAGHGGAKALLGRDLDDDGDTDIAAVLSSGRVATFARQDDTSWTYNSLMASSYTANALGAIDVELGSNSFLLVGTVGSTSGIYLVPFWSDSHLAQEILLVDHPSAVRSNDIDRDGDLDYVWADFYRGGISWHAYNPGSSSITHAVARSFTHAVWLDTGDLDRDGDLDIIAASDTNGLAWWANNGSGTAWTEHTITKNEFYHGSSMALADLDADGDLDVVAGTDRQLVWHENLGHPKGTHNWIRHVIDTSPHANSDGYAVAVGDIDRDGRIDIAGCDVETGPGTTAGRRLGWWENERQAVPAAGIEFAANDIDSTLTGAWGVDVADFDGDGWLEVAASGYGAGGVTGQTRLYDGASGSPWTWSTLFTASFDKGRGLAAYRTGNGRPTYVISGEAYTGEAREFWSSNWTWTASGQAARVTGLGTTYQSAVGDVDDDGVPDIIGTSASENDIVWWNGRTGTRTVIDGNCAGARAVCVGDIDDDGLMDVGAACAGENNLIWLRQTGDPIVPWDRLPSNAAFAGATDVACGDLDGDGRTDLVAARPGGEIGAQTYVASGGGGTFVWHWVTQAFTGTEHLALGDIDCDGDLDVAATSASRQEIRWFENTGSGFTSHVVDESVGSVREIAIGDINRDGAPDLVVASQDRALVRWYEQRVQTALSIDKALDPSSTAVISTGQSITYALNVTNNGFAADVWVVDRWDPPHAVVDAGSDQDCVTDLGQGMMTCTLALQGGGQIKPMRVVLTPSLLFDGLITNTAQVLPVSPCWNNTSYLDTDDAPPVDVQQDTTIWDGWVNPGAPPRETLAPGSTFTYSVGIFNLGPKSGANATMIHTWSPTQAIDGMVVLGSSLATAAAGYDCTIDVEPWEVHCTVTDLSPGAPLTLTLAVTTSSQFSGTIEAGARLFGPDGDEGNPANNQTRPLRVGARPLDCLYLPLVLRVYP